MNVFLGNLKQVERQTLSCDKSRVGGWGGGGGGGRGGGGVARRLSSEFELRRGNREPFHMCGKKDQGNGGNQVGSAHL